jgi:1,4-alpha-glucan branching enzyme
VAFAVWAPGARAVTVTGEFDGWDARRHPMRSLGASGVWELFVPGAQAGQLYKFAVTGADGLTTLRADPLARAAEEPPATASRVDQAAYVWHDEGWMAERGARSHARAPMSIYEVHLGSWRRGLGFRQLADELPAYVAGLGFSHVELMPVMQHPFAGSWGYQVTGYFAPDSRLGTPDDLRLLIDRLHAAGIGVLLDWVPGHFPRDVFALARFDGTALYEHDDPRLGAHPDWGTLIFNFGRTEVRNFLVANALYWLQEFHADGLRVDAVASMLYLDYSRGPGEWLPNADGGNENLAAVAFLQELNREVYGRHPGAITVAEESTAWPGVSRPVHDGGLGFGFKWNMGFMHDSLHYFSRDPVHRRHHHDDMTRPLLWAFAENHFLPVSHDEVVHGKGSLYGRMPGDDWQRRANLRAYLACLWTYPGKPLVFMGCEIAQCDEWDHDGELDWAAADAGVAALVRDLNALLHARPALYASDPDAASFSWLSGTHGEDNVLAFRRVHDDDAVCIVANLSPVVRDPYDAGLPDGAWEVVLNTDAVAYGGTGVGPGGGAFRLPPLGVLVLARTRS